MTPKDPDDIQPPSAWDLDKRLSMVEADLKRVNDAQNSIASKIENLPDRIVVQLKQVIQQELQLHTAQCPGGAKKNEKDDEGGFWKILTKNLVSIISMTIAVIAVLLGLKP